MAAVIKTIYGNFQYAGVPITGTGKSTPTNDGLAPLAPVMALLGGDSQTLNSSTNGIYVTVTGGEGGAATLATNQVSVAATAGGTVIAALRAGRNAITIINGGSTAVYIGVSGVSTTTGALLPGVAGAALTIPTTAAVYGITASGTQTVSFLETY